MALLCRFAAVHRDDNVDRAVAIVQAAFDSLRPPRITEYWPDSVNMWLRRNDARDFGLTWHTDAAGNHYVTADEATQYGYYTMRLEPSNEAGAFSYGAWRALLSAARATMRW
jgi:hypothetical protein